MPARAGPSRSQRSQQPSQYHSQRRRGGRADPEDDENSDDDGPEMDPDGDMDIEQTQGGDADGSDASLTRLSLPCSLTHASSSPISILTKGRAI